MQSPPPPPPPSYGAGQPPMVPPGYGAVPVPGNLASSGLRIVGGLIDFIILCVVDLIIDVVLRDTRGLAGPIDTLINVLYFAYFWSSRGQSIGMMAFGFKVRDIRTGQYPTMGMAALRGFLWTIEAFGTFCLLGAIGWLWQLWDPQRQAIHDKVAGTIVTTS